MISNERQYRISKRQLERLRQAVAEFDIKAASERIGSERLAATTLQALRSEEEVLLSQVSEYESLRSGAVTDFAVSSLDELPRMLIRARIAQHLPQRELAARVGVKEQQIQRYEATEYSSASLRRLLEIAAALKLSVCQTTQPAQSSKIEVPVESGELDWSRFPVREMYRRHWFEGFTGSLDAAVQASDTLVKEYVQSVIKRPAAALHRKHVRARSSLDDYALMAWECRILGLAAKANLSAAFQDQSIDPAWVSELAKQSSHPDGPLRAREALREVGIAMIIEPHLPGTHLDGAALLHNGVPVIGMTLRYDRVDNFWFVLFHELFHVIKHLRRGGLGRTFDDLDAVGEDKVERQADDLAGEALIPSVAWDHALARYVRSPESIEAFAGELGISPSIVAGRIRNEANNYVILADLVGQGGVRKHFPEADFGA